MEITRHKVDGKEYSISVDSNGRFCAVVDGHGVYADSLEGLKQKLTRMLRKAGVRINLPAVYELQTSTYGHDETGKFEAVTITGIHQRNRTILIKRANGKADAVDAHYNMALYQPKMDQKKYQALLKARDVARDAFDKYVQEFRFTKKAIEDLVNKAETDAGIEDGEKD